MKTAVVVNALLDGSRWVKPLAGRDPIDGLLDKLFKSFAREDVFFLADDESVAHIASHIHGLHTIRVRDRNAKRVFQKLFKELDSYEDVAYLFADTPLIDTELTERLLHVHREEYAEYTYGEGFPFGVTPEVLKRELFAKISSLISDEHAQMERDSIFSALSKEINSFDIESVFSPEDLKIRRIDLSTSLKRNALIVERVVQRKGLSCGYDDFRELIRTEPGILRTVPAYAEMEITDRVSSPCIYSLLSVLKRKTGTMQYEDFTKIIDTVADFSGGITVEFSLSGEPLLHPDIRKIMEHALAKENVHLIVPTDGLVFDPAFSDYVSGLGTDNLSIIFMLDASEETTYGMIRGGDLKKAERNARYLLSKGVKNVYVQFVRINENEHEMLKFFEMWEEEGAQVIIQKYNSYIGLLPQRSKYDLRPLERNSCWHLLRDIVVFHNGDVPRCKQDVNGLFHFGNLLSGDIKSVWESGLPHYLRHCEKQYDEYCSKCDEYYTFNF
jgi:spiro-SPASM protein